MQKAFTLIELVIVIAIIGIMAVAAIPAFNNFGAQSKLNNKADEIKLFMDKAYQMSISPAVGCNGAEVAIISGSNPQLVLTAGYYANCATGTCDPVIPKSTETLLLNETANDGFSIIDLAPAGSPVIIRFVTPSGRDNISMTNASETVKFVIALNSHASRKQVSANRYPFNVDIATSPTRAQK